jgi:lipopolysaccharide/colanic/teichoic acid biosynthesis glycosyltransferase
MAKKTAFRVKRFFDITAVFIGMLFVIPISAGIAFYIKKNSPGKVLFKQERAGYRGQPFICYKFRTMTEEKGLGGELLPDEIRLKSWGKFLRSISLDELPQLWNVLKGEMSLIGPRPLPIKYLAFYTPEQMRRHEMRPGMTGWTSVNGRNNLDWDTKFKMDIWYIEHWSLWLDIKIFFKTVYKVICRDDTHKIGYATRDVFTGAKSMERLPNRKVKKT